MNSTETVIELENNLLEAFKANNRGQIEKLLHKDLLFVIPTGDTINKQNDLDNMESGLLQISDLTLLDRKIRQVENAVTVVSVIALVGSFAGTPFEAKYKYLRVWLNAGGVWQVVSGSGMEIKGNF